MERQNITLSVPIEILRKAKHLAIERETSVSGLLAAALEDLVRRSDTFRRSRERHRRILEEGLDLGTKDVLDVKRDDLHER